MSHEAQDRGVSPTGRDLIVRVVSTSAELEAMRDEWNALLASSSSNTLFLTWEWVHTWWAIYGGEASLFVLTARTPAGELVGIAPLQRTPKRLFGLPIGDLVSFIGYGSDVTPEYLDIIIKRGWTATALATFTAYIKQDASICGLDLRPLSAQSSTADQLVTALSTVTGDIRCTRDSTAPILPLPESVEAFLANQSRNYRKKIRESENRCARAFDARVRLSASIDDVRRDMEALARLHAERWNGGSRAFRSRRYVEFHQRVSALMFERGWLRLFSLECGTGRLASLYCFSYNHRYYFYQSGRDPQYAWHRVGLVLMHRAIQQAIAERASCFDFLRGREVYKYRWASAEEHNLRLTFMRSRTARLIATQTPLRPEMLHPLHLAGRFANAFTSAGNVG